MSQIPYNKFINSSSPGIDFTIVTNTRKSNKNYLFFNFRKFQCKSF